MSIALNTAKCQVLKALIDLEEADLAAINSWLCNGFNEDLNRMKAFISAETVIDKMRATLKEITPFKVEYPAENINMPEVGDQADCTKENTCHIDEFLYDEEDVDKLVEQKKIQRRYCVDCKSRNIEDLTFISHSMSKTSIHYVFKVLLPFDLEDKRILDVGSRLGAVMFGGYYFSNAGSIVGIEMSKDWCNVVEQMIDRYDLDRKRVQVHWSDVLNCAHAVNRSNIIFINVLDFFVDKEKHIRMWHFFKDNISKGSYLITNRSAEETFEYLDIYDEFSEWLKMCRPFQPQNEIFFALEDFNYGDLCLYSIV